MIEPPATALESELWQKGLFLVAGVDEAGRGALAGPVAAGAVILPVDCPPLTGVTDSKLLSPRQREQAAEKIKTHALHWGVGFASAAEIDSVGILPATRLAVLRALAALPVKPDYLLMDYLPWKDCPLPRQSLPKGELRSLSIAAASILAKTARDALLRDLDAVYPLYGFARHKGYGTLAHRQSIAARGPCPEHRRSFLRGLSPG